MAHANAHGSNNEDIFCVLCGFFVINRVDFLRLSGIEVSQ